MILGTGNNGTENGYNHIKFILFSSICIEHGNLWLNVKKSINASIGSY